MSLKEKLTEYLEQCDLTQNDATIYLCLLKQGQLGPSEIAKETGIRRARVYDSLKRLIDRGFVVQEIEKKRPRYTITNPKLLLSELEKEISLKKEAYDEIKKSLIDQPPTPEMKGIYFYNTNDSLRLKIREMIEASRQKISIMAVFPASIRDENLLPFQLLTKKSLSGQEILLLLNIHSKNYELCVDLFSENVKIYHFPLLKKISTLIHIIDDESLFISLYNQQRDKIILNYGILFSAQKDFITTINFIMEGFIEKSLPLKKRLEELRKSIIYPTTKLKTIFGID